MTAPHPLESPATSSDPLRVTVVDDDVNEHLLFGLAAATSRAELDVQYAADGATFLRDMHRTEMLGHPCPDVVVLDLRLPVMPGPRVLAELRASAATADLPVLVMSSSVRPADRAAALAAGAQWFEPKPTEFDDLVALVASLPARIAATRRPRQEGRP